MLVPKQLGHCIVCHQDNVPMSDEHVIPKAIGGCYHVFTVCDDCNSKRFGKKVDPLLIEHPLIQLIRWQKKLKSYKGSYPHPLSKPVYGTDGTIYYVKENGTDLEPHIFPTTEVEYDNNGLLKSVKLQIDTEDEADVDEILAKRLSREGIDLSKFSSSKTVTRISEKLTLHYHWIMDLHDFNLDLLKMAYEFTCDSLPNYENDETAKIIADVLYSCDPKRLSEVHMANVKLDKLIDRIFGDYIDFSTDDRHYLFLICTKGKVLCLVWLFNSLCTGFVMSDTMGVDFLKTRVLINDTAKHQYENFLLEELITKVSGNCKVSFEFDKKRYKGALNLDKYVTNEEAYFAHDCNGNTILFDENNTPISLLFDYVQSLHEGNIRDTVTAGCHTTYYFPNRRVSVVYNAGNEFIPIKAIVCTSQINKY